MNFEFQNMCLIAILIEIMAPAILLIIMSDFIYRFNIKPYFSFILFAKKCLKVKFAVSKSLVSNE